MNTNDNGGQTVEVRYDQPAVTFTNQFLVTAGKDEMVLDLSSGVIRSNGQDILPVHTRLALSYETAERLVRVLQEVTSQHRQTAIADIRHPSAGIPVATLPTMNPEHGD